MAMSVGGSGGEQGAIASINTTPLVDVMLVLLIIFLITIPVINKTVKVGSAEGGQHPDADQAGEHHHRGRQGRQHLLERQDASPTARTCWPT